MGRKMTNRQPFRLIRGVPDTLRKYEAVRVVCVCKKCLDTVGIGWATVDERRIFLDAITKKVQLVMAEIRVNLKMMSNDYL
jgi:hypothetical protein